MWTGQRRERGKNHAVLSNSVHDCCRNKHSLPAPNIFMLPPDLVHCLLGTMSVTWGWPMSPAHEPIPKLCSLTMCAAWLFCYVKPPMPPQQPLGARNWASPVEAVGATPVSLDSNHLLLCVRAFSAHGNMFDLWREQARNAGELMPLGVASTNTDGKLVVDAPAPQPSVGQR